MRLVMTAFLMCMGLAPLPLTGCGSAEPLAEDAKALTESAETEADSPLALDYYFGNQIYGSYVQIKRDGTIVHSERNCCPPRTDPRPEAALSGDALRAMLAEIENAARGTVKRQPYTSAEGALYGQLQVYTAAKKKVLIRTFTFGAQQLNTSPDAAKLVSLANHYAQQDM